MKNLEYSFLRAEKNNDFVIFVKIEPEWLEKNIDFGLIGEKLVVEFDNTKYESKILEPILMERLHYVPTSVIFADQDGNFLTETMLSPIVHKKMKP